MFYTNKELQELGFNSIGDNVLISNKSSIYGAKNIDIGSNVRIDDFCIISAGKGGIRIGDYVHIACNAQLIGEGEIIVEDHSQISGKVSIYSSSDDFSGDFLVGPTIPSELTNVKSVRVHLEKYVILGCNVVVLPGVTIGQGTSVGALSLVSKDLPSSGIYVGNPIRFIKQRTKGYEDLILKL
jgi:galactoside O-acetyltransferase|tara:strand:+ start:1908 stop:2456 length:549 start_codon:yes stop_codon:yes gene_type:complete